MLHCAFSNYNRNYITVRWTWSLSLLDTSRFREVMEGQSTSQPEQKKEHPHTSPATRARNRTVFNFRGRVVFRCYQYLACWAGSKRFPFRFFIKTPSPLLCRSSLEQVRLIFPFQSEQLYQTETLFLTISIYLFLSSCICLWCALWSTSSSSAVGTCSQSRVKRRKEQ